MSGNRLVLDTNIVLGFLAGRTDTTSYLNGQQDADLAKTTYPDLNTVNPAARKN